MRPKRKCRTILVSILTLAFLLGAGMIGATWADKTNLDPVKRIQMTGRIDRIGSGDIVIDDTWFKLSGVVSTSGFKVGDAVEVAADSNYVLIELRYKKNTISEE